jgi:hypothetical protein
MSSERWMILAVIVAVALIAWNLWDFKGGEKILQTTITPTPQSNTSFTQGDASFTQTQIQTYTAILNEYEGKRIQFDDNCGVQPTGVTYKNGTALMFDNRSATAKTIKIAEQTYEFPPYGYKILTLSSVTLPATLNISCNDSVNVLKILLQAD